MLCILIRVLIKCDIYGIVFSIQYNGFITGSRVSVMFQLRLSLYQDCKL